MKNKVLALGNEPRREKNETRTYKKSRISWWIFKYMSAVAVKWKGMPGFRQVGGRDGALEKRSFLKLLWRSDASIQSQELEMGVNVGDIEGEPIKETGTTRCRNWCHKIERLCRWEIKKRREERTGRGCAVRDGETEKWREVVPSIAPSAQQQSQRERRAWLLVATHRATVTRGALLQPACLPH